MQALVLNAYNADLETAIRGLRFGVRPVPRLKPGQVLVKMEAAPCNPSDLLFLNDMKTRNIRITLDKKNSIPGFMSQVWFKQRISSVLVVGNLEFLWDQ